MANVYSRIDQAATHLVEIGLDLRGMIADGTVDAEELRRLTGHVEELLSEATAVEDVALDIQLAQQVLRLGRARAPNDPLRRRLADLDRLRAQSEAPDRCERSEAGEPVGTNSPAV